MEKQTLICKSLRLTREHNTESQFSKLTRKTVDPNQAIHTNIRDNRSSLGGFHDLRWFSGSVTVYMGAGEEAAKSGKESVLLPDGVPCDTCRRSHGLVASTSSEPGMGLNAH